MEGHSDDRGAAEYNLALGDRRASVVRELLVGNGIPEERLVVLPLGEVIPSCSQNTEQCWQRNRRVHFAIKKN